MRSVPFLRSLAVMAALLLVAVGVASAGSPDDPAATWQKVWPEIQRAEVESMRMVDKQAAAIGEVFDRVKGNGRPFASEVLGTEGKLRYAASGVEQGASAIQGLFDSMMGTQRSPAPDSFATFVRGRFVRHILEPAAF